MTKRELIDRLQSIAGDDNTEVQIANDLGDYYPILSVDYDSEAKMILIDPVVENEEGDDDDEDELYS